MGTITEKLLYIEYDFVTRTEMRNVKFVYKGYFENHFITYDQLRQMLNNYVGDVYYYTITNNNFGYNGKMYTVNGLQQFIHTFSTSYILDMLYKLSNEYKHLEFSFDKQLFKDVRHALYIVCNEYTKRIDCENNG